MYTIHLKEMGTYFTKCFYYFTILYSIYNLVKFNFLKSGHLFYSIFIIILLFMQFLDIIETI